MLYRPSISSPLTVIDILSQRVLCYDDMHVVRLREKKVPEMWGGGVTAVVTES